MSWRKTSKMKWCFLINPAPLLIEFLGKLSREVVKGGDEYILVANSKIAEYDKKKYFPKDVKIFSEVDWCLENYKKNQKEFGGLSWKEFFPEFDRFNRFKLFKYDYNNSVEIISQSYQFLDFVFQKEKPEVVVSEAPTGIFNEVSYYLCKKFNLTYLGLIGSRFDGRIDIYDSKHTCPKYKNTFREMANCNISEAEKKFARDFIKNFLSHKQLPPYVTFQNQNIHLGEINRIKRYIKREKEMCRYLFRYFLNRKYFRPFDYNSEFLLKYGFRYPLDFLKCRFRILLQKNIFNSLSNNDDKFFLFPLHLQPESSTSVQATYFCDQLNTVMNIAFSLPLPYKLYVKEHPAAIGTRPSNFYRKLKEIPNVVLISPNEDTENLIKKSQGVITLTSTIGMEAALAGKPVYVLGNVFYSYHPLCQKVNSFEELKQKIEMDLVRKPDIDDLEDINLRFILSYFKNTIAGEVAAAISENDTNDYKAIYKEIKRIFFYGKTNFI
jgi:hypothetical protein